MRVRIPLPPLPRAPSVADPRWYILSPPDRTAERGPPDSWAFGDKPNADPPGGAIRRGSSIGRAPTPGGDPGSNPGRATFYTQLRDPTMWYVGPGANDTPARFSVTVRATCKPR